VTAADLAKKLRNSGFTPTRVTEPDLVADLKKALRRRGKI